MLQQDANAESDARDTARSWWGGNRLRLCLGILAALALLATWAVRDEQPLREEGKASPAFAVARKAVLDAKHVCPTVLSVARLPDGSKFFVICKKSDGSELHYEIYDVGGQVVVSPR